MLPETFWGRIQYLLQQYGASFLSGAGNTMIIAIVGTFLGCLIGFIVGIIQTIPVDKRDSAVKKTLVGFLKFIMACYVEFFRGTPMMVQAMFIYYGSAYLFNINMSMWFAAFFVVSINTGAYMAETVRGGILSVDEGQTEAAKAIGMTHVQTMMNVILPQALRNIMPQIGNNLIINIKDTCATIFTASWSASCWSIPTCLCRKSQSITLLVNSDEAAFIPDSVRDILPYGSFRMYPSSLRRWVIFTVLALDTPTSRETSDELITGPFIPRRYIANRYFFCA